MRIFGFDLLPYPEHLDHLKKDGELAYPLPKRHFRPELAVQNYRDHLDAWALMEELGFEGIVSKRLGSSYRSGRSRDWLKMKNPNAPAVKREAQEDWGRR